MNSLQRTRTSTGRLAEIPKLVIAYDEQGAESLPFEVEDNYVASVKRELFMIKGEIYLSLEYVMVNKLKPYRAQSDNLYKHRHQFKVSNSLDQLKKVFEAILEKKGFDYLDYGTGKDKCYDPIPKYWRLGGAYIEEFETGMNKEYPDYVKQLIVYPTFKDDSTRYTPIYLPKETSARWDDFASDCLDFLNK